MSLRAEKINKQYNRSNGKGNHFYAVGDTNLSLEKGKLTTLIGRSGSGKTALLNMLAGLLHPTEGKVFLGDTDIYALDDPKLAMLRNSSIGVIPQGRAVLDTLTVMENLLLPSRLYQKKENEEMKKQAKLLLDELGIGNLADVYPDELSGGEVRRVSIARTLLLKPDVILADEPTGDLDDANTKLVLEMFRKTADSGVAVLLVTHELTALEYADNVYTMEAGILKQGR